MLVRTTVAISGVSVHPRRCSLLRGRRTCCLTGPTRMVVTSVTMTAIGRRLTPRLTPRGAVMTDSQCSAITCGTARLAGQTFRCSLRDGHEGKHMDLRGTGDIVAWQRPRLRHSALPLLGMLLTIAGAELQAVPLEVNRDADDANDSDDTDHNDCD